MSFFASDTAYDAFMGRYSTQLAVPFAQFAGIEAGLRVADVGAGTGALTRELVRLGAEAAAVDPSEPFVTALRERFPSLDAQAAPAERLPWPDGLFDAALAQLVVAFMDDATAGIAEMRRVVRLGGTVAVCMWDDEGMDMLAAVRRAQTAVGNEGPRADRRYRERDEIESLFGDGFEDVTTDLLVVESTYAGFEEFWAALAGGAGPAGVWAATLEGDALAEARAAMRRELDDPEGAFTLVGRAWAARGTRV